MAVTLLVLLKSPFSKRAALRWTISSLYMLHRVYGSHTHEAYVFHNWSCQRFEALFIHRCWTAIEVPLQDVEACSCFLSCDVNMTVPGQVRADRHSEVSCILDPLQFSVMDMVVLCMGSLLVGDPDNLTLSASNCISQLCSQSCSLSRSS